MAEIVLSPVQQSVSQVTLKYVAQIVSYFLGTRLSFSIKLMHQLQQKIVIYSF